MDIKLAETRYAHKLPSQREMALMDQRTIEAGTPASALMERAGLAVHKAIRARYEREGLSSVCILCGPGNNGGDGLVLARLFLSEGVPVRVILAAESRLSELCAAQLDSYLSAGGEAVSIEGGAIGNIACPAIAPDCAADLMEKSSLIVDALLGTGQREAPRGKIAFVLEIIQQLRPSQAIVAVDIPTGVNADSGEIYSPCVAADFTVCIELVKRGLLQYPARRVCGQLCAVSIGIDASLECEFELLSRQTVPPPPLRAADAHKGDFGHVLVIGGSRGMPGAAELCAAGALRSGAGLVSKTAFAGVATNTSMPEIILEIVDDDGKGYLGLNCAKQLVERGKNVSVAVLGPGMGQNRESGELLERFLSEVRIPVVLDADGLNLFASKADRCQHPNLVLTPHPGEAARLLGSTSAQVQRDRYRAAAALAAVTGAVVVLKGASTVVHDGRVGFVNLTGNPYMATAGSGDVLAGIVAGLIAQGMPALEAAKTGVFAHGMAGDLAHRTMRGPIVASDIIARIPEALGSLVGGVSFWK